MKIFDIDTYFQRKDLMNNTIKNECILDCGEIRTYDTCFQDDAVFFKHFKEYYEKGFSYLGRGKLFSIQGHRQLKSIKYYHFWNMDNTNKINSVSVKDDQIVVEYSNLNEDVLIYEQKNYSIQTGVFKELRKNTNMKGYTLFAEHNDLIKGYWASYANPTGPHNKNINIFQEDGGVKRVMSVGLWTSHLASLNGLFPNDPIMEVLIRTQKGYHKGFVRCNSILHYLDNQGHQVGWVYTSTGMVNVEILKNGEPINPKSKLLEEII